MGVVHARGLVRSWEEGGVEERGGGQEGREEQGMLYQSMSLLQTQNYYIIITLDLGIASIILVCFALLLLA